MRVWRQIAAALAFVGFVAGAATGATITAQAEQQRLARGVNIIGYDPLWNDPSKARFKTYHFTRIKQAGFSTVRVVLQSFAHMRPDGTLNPQWLRTLDWVVDRGTGAGLNVILDEHDFNLCSDDPAACTAKLKAFWGQIASRYANRGNDVLFELLNEPHGALDADQWNRILAELIPLVRASNPTRTLVIGPTHWNSRADLDKLQLPESDRHIIVTYHYYDPMRFTHQGASWVPEYTNVSGVTCCTAEERATIDRDFDQVQAWSKAHDRPILLGEFGAREGGDMASRAAWTSAVARSAERHGFAWAYWQFDSDFVVWDMAKDDWVHPILDALIPPAH